MFNELLIIFFFSKCVVIVCFLLLLSSTVSYELDNAEKSPIIRNRSSSEKISHFF